MPGAHERARAGGSPSGRDVHEVTTASRASGHGAVPPVLTGILSGRIRRRPRTSSRRRLARMPGALPAGLSSAGVGRFSAFGPFVFPPTPFLPGSNHPRWSWELPERRRRRLGRLVRPSQGGATCNVFELRAEAAQLFAIHLGERPLDERELQRRIALLLSRNGDGGCRSSSDSVARAACSPPCEAFTATGRRHARTRRATDARAAASIQ